MSGWHFYPHINGDLSRHRLIEDALMQKKDECLTPRQILPEVADEIFSPSGKF
jgi:hypothetical protein